MKLLCDYIITDKDTKKSLLVSEDGISKCKFLTFEELRDILIFKIEDEALLYVYEKYKLPFSLIKEIFSYMYYVNSNNENEKIKLIEDIKNDLILNQLISFDEIKARTFKNKNIVFYNAKKSKNIKYLFDLLKVNNNVSYYDEESKLLPLVYKALNNDYEIQFVFQRIIDLLINGVAIEDIAICNVGKDDYSILNKYQNIYNVSVNVPASGNVLNAKMVNDLFVNLTNYNNLIEAVQKLNSNDDSYIFGLIIDIINQYNLTNYSIRTTVDFFKHILENKKYEPIIYDKAIKINDCNARYQFFINFNEGIAPTTIKDEGYLSSNDLKLLGLDSVDEMNKINLHALENTITTKEGLVLTYHHTKDGKIVNPSKLVSNLNLKVVDIKYEYGKSIVADKINLAAINENYNRYGVYNDVLDIYDTSFLRDTYNHSFKFNNKAIFNEYLNKLDKLTLSYTSMSNFFKCSFAYYLNKFLRLSEYEDTLGATLGQFAHKILEDSYNDDFNLEVNKDKYFEVFKTSKEKFFGEIMFSLVKKVIEFNKESEERSALDQKMLEGNIDVKVDELFTFNGRIDKMLYKLDGDNAYIAIIDYKTGGDKPSLNNLEDGLNLQLPSYIYLASNMDEFKDKKITIIGIYLQKINMANTDKDIKNTFKLEGYTINDKDVISILDPTFNNSKYIYGLKTNNDGSINKNSKVLTSDDFKKLKNIVADRIKDVVSNIYACNFKIAPIKMPGDKVDACKYCKFSDICFVQEDDYRKISEKGYKGE